MPPLKGGDMNTYEAITTRRSIRAFQDKPISKELLEKYVNAGRLAPQAANRQPLEFVAVDDKELLTFFFDNTKLANYLDWEATKDVMAQAYIVILANKDIQKDRWIPYDVSLAAENISLAAWEDGIGSCMIGAFNKVKVTEKLQVPGNYDVNLVLALGYPAHQSVVEEMKGDDCAYWHDNDGTFHIPKRSLKKVLHFNKF